MKQTNKFADNERMDFMQMDFMQKPTTTISNSGKINNFIVINYKYINNVNI